MNLKDRVIVLGDVNHVTKAFMCRVKGPRLKALPK
jgi:hypothetical protein